MGIYLEHHPHPYSKPTKFVCPQDTKNERTQLPLSRVAQPANLKTRLRCLVEEVKSISVM
jgi:hypothetical protein